MARGKCAKRCNLWQIWLICYLLFNFFMFSHLFQPWPTFCGHNEKTTVRFSLFFWYLKSIIQWNIALEFPPTTVHPSWTQVQLHSRQTQCQDTLISSRKINLNRNGTNRNRKGNLILTWENHFLHPIRFTPRPATIFLNNNMRVVKLTMIPSWRTILKTMRIETMPPLPKAKWEWHRPATPQGLVNLKMIFGWFTLFHKGFVRMILFLVSFHYNFVYLLCFVW